MTPVFAVPSPSHKRGEQHRRRHVAVFVYRRAAPHTPIDSPRGGEQGERADWAKAWRSGRMSGRPLQEVAGDVLCPSCSPHHLCCDRGSATCAVANTHTCKDAVDVYVIPPPNVEQQLLPLLVCANILMVAIKQQLS